MYILNAVLVITSRIYLPRSATLSFTGNTFPSTNNIRQIAFAVGLVYTNGYLQSMRGKNTHVGRLIVLLSDTSETLLLFVRIDGWDPHKIQIGKKMIFYM